MWSTELGAYRGAQGDTQADGNKKRNYYRLNIENDSCTTDNT